MPEKKKTLGQAIDQIIDALNSLELDARKTAIEAACSHLGIKSDDYQAIPSTLHSASPSSQASLPQTKSTMPLSPTIDIRTLKEQKQPKSAQQMACVVAYYLQELAPESDRKISVTAGDLEKYFKQASFKLPKSLTQVLVDGKIAGYFESSQARGEYKLNAVGYNLVAHNLPKKKAK